MAGEVRQDGSFLSELRALEAFRKRYHREYPDAQLIREDPDVRLLLEALAFFMVRTREGMLDNLAASWRRLVTSYFGYLLDPLPAVSVVQGVVTPRMAETVVVPPGTELLFTTQDGHGATFQTTQELRIVPAALESVELMLRPGGFRIILSFRSQYRRTDPIGQLSIFLNDLDDYGAALELHYQLRRHLQRAAIIYDQQVDEQTVGTPCAVTFGSYSAETDGVSPRNPLQNARSFFHFPQEDLLLNISVPPPQRAWTRFAVCLDLGPNWPRTQLIHRDLFHPFAVPVRNLRRAYAKTILCDGTQDGYPILQDMQERDWALQSVCGVYEVQSGSLVPLVVASAATGGSSYEIEERRGAEQQRGPYLLLQLPQAIARPRKLVVEALWHQPGFAGHANGRIHAVLRSRQFAGLDWVVRGGVRRGIDSSLRDQASELLFLLSLKMKPTLDRDELQRLLRLLGTLPDSPYAPLLERISAVKVRALPDGTRRGATIKHRYEIDLEEHAPSEEALVWNFLRLLRAILDAWNHEAPVELEARIAGQPFAVPIS